MCSRAINFKTKFTFHKNPNVLELLGSWASSVTCRNTLFKSSTSPLFLMGKTRKLRLMRFSSLSRRPALYISSIMDSLSQKLTICLTGCVTPIYITRTRIGSHFISRRSSSLCLMMKRCKHHIHRQGLIIEVYNIYFAPVPCWYTTWLGYSPLGMEKIVQHLDNTKDIGESRAHLRDMKESFECGREEDEIMPNIWLPENVLPGFKEACLDFFWVCYHPHKLRIHSNPLCFRKLLSSKRPSWEHSLLLLIFLRIISYGGTQGQTISFASFITQGITGTWLHSICKMTLIEFSASRWKLWRWTISPELTVIQTMGRSPFVSFFKATLSSAHSHL